MLKPYSSHFFIPKSLFAPIATVLLSFTLHIAEAQETAASSSITADTVSLGYSTKNKTAITAAVTTVPSQQFNKGLVVTPEELISGLVPGLQVVNYSSAPGYGSIVRLRGNIIPALIVLDGVMLNENATGGMNLPQNLLNPDDIASITVLRDVAATGIYGTRGVNGVLVITSKRGSSNQKAQVDFRSTASLSTLTKKVDVLSASEFRQVVNQRGTPQQKNLLGISNTDWQDEIYRKALSHEQNLSFSGTSGKLPYRVSLNYLDQQGIIKNSHFKRSSASLNLNPSLLNNHLKVDLSLKGSIGKNRSTNDKAILSAVSFDPTQPVYATNNYGGYFEWLDSKGMYVRQAPSNPVSIIEQDTNEAEAKLGFGNLHLNYNFPFLPDLHAHLNLGYDVTTGYGNNFSPATSALASYMGGYQFQYEQTRKNRLGELYFSYHKDLEKLRSQLDLTLGYSTQNIKTELSSSDKYGMNAGINTSTWFNTKQVAKAFFGQVNFNVKNRYFLTANLRKDGSPYFAPQNQWFLSKSFGLSWLLTKEEFFSNSDLLSELKLRLSYGIVGSHGMLPGSVNYTGQINFSQTSFDPNLDWEKTRKVNTGIDFGFKQERLYGSVDFYSHKTKDLNIMVPSPGDGLSFNGLNEATLTSKGIEVNLNHNIISSDKVNLVIGLNAAYNKSNITVTNNTEDALYEGIPYAIGSSLSPYFAPYGSPGFTTSSLQGTRKNLLPKYLLGLNSQLSYKKWGFDFLARAHYGNYVFNNVASYLGNFSILNSNAYLTNLSSSILETGFPNPQFIPQNYYVENASFIRMEYLSLSYNVGKVLQDKATLKLVATVQNAFLITKYSGQDPERLSGIESANYPRPRIYSLSLNLGL